LKAEPLSQAHIQAQLEHAVRLHVSGNREKAAEIYERILAVEPANADALNLRALIAHDLGQRDEALALFDRAVNARPAFAEAHFNRALTLAAIGRTDEALEAYTQAAQVRPDYADARLNIGIVLHGAGKTAEAIAAFRVMTEHCPLDARGHYNLGACLLKSLDNGNAETRDAMVSEALAALEKSLVLDPKNADALLALGNLHALQNDRQAAIAYAQKALALNPPWSDDLRADVFSDLGENLRKEKSAAEAVAAHRIAIAIRPRSRIIRYNLAAALFDVGQSDEAIEIYTDLIKSDPHFVKAYVNLANIYQDRNRNKEAIDLLELSLTIEPTRQALTSMAAVLADMGWFATSLMILERTIDLHAADESARFNRTIILLGVGRLAEGWPDYERRFDVSFVDTIRLPTPPPYWQGEDLANKKILVWTEQGLGDEILFASIIPQVVERAGQVLIECAARMAPIYRRSFPTATVVGRKSANTAVAPREGWDYQISIASLAPTFRPDLTHFPRHGGYLKSDPVKTAALRRSYEGLAQGRRIVGLSWRSKNPKIGKNKTADLVNFAPVLSVPGVMFVNLQYGDCAADLSAIKDRLGVDIHNDVSINPLADMDGFFAQVAAMDLVITTSNTTVHVAGSLNVPTWLLLPHGKGILWYWFRRRADSPWYPSVKITRRDTVDAEASWEIEPIERLAEDLRAFVAARDAWPT